MKSTAKPSEPRTKDFLGHYYTLFQNGSIIESGQILWRVAPQHYLVAKNKKGSNDTVRVIRGIEFLEQCEFFETKADTLSETIRQLYGDY